MTQYYEQLAVAREKPKYRLALMLGVCINQSIPQMLYAKHKMFF
jgi:hypothetical protein